MIFLIKVKVISFLFWHETTSWYLVEVLERCQYSVAEPPSPCACDPSRNLQGSLLFFAGSLSVKNKYQKIILARLIDTPKQTQPYRCHS